MLIKYHLMEVREQSLDELLRWADDAPLVARLLKCLPPRGLHAPAQWITRSVAKLVEGGALLQDNAMIRDV